MMKIEMLSFLKNLTHSWILNEDTCQWEAPVVYPDDDNKYTWNESTLTWDIVEV
jgi:hypothetical protein